MIDILYMLAALGFVVTLIMKPMVTLTYVFAFLMLMTPVIIFILVCYGLPYRKRKP